jgi:shikimate dehydrogenase
MIFDTYDHLERHKDAGLIVNTTPVGMYPENGEALIDPADFPQLTGIADVVYNPARTELLLRAERAGIPYAGGLHMLVSQAKKSAEIWLDRTIPDSEVLRIRKLLEVKMQNIILIGMPGCGKSSVGRILAGLLKRPFLDLDEAIQREDGRTPEQIILQDGEAAFRDAETAAVKRAGKETGLVIACGGGVPLRTENVRALRQNGKIFWIRRELEKLSVEGRPLSADLPALYEKRRPCYEAAADLALVPDLGQVV